MNSVAFMPIVGVEYDFFDDGKIRESRKTSVVITEVILFKEMDAATKQLWESEVESCYWLYAPSTDYFVKGIINGDEKVVFVQTKDGGWFSLGFWGGRLKEKSFWEKEAQQVIQPDK